MKDGLGWGVCVLPDARGAPCSAGLELSWAPCCPQAPEPPAWALVCGFRAEPPLLLVETNPPWGARLELVPCPAPRKAAPSLCPL